MSTTPTHLVGLGARPQDPHAITQTTATATGLTLICRCGWTTEIPTTELDQTNNEALMQATWSQHTNPDQ